jgi:hypothetical protein
MTGGRYSEALIGLLTRAPGRLALMKSKTAGGLRRLVTFNPNHRRDDMEF